VKYAICSVLVGAGLAGGVVWVSAQQPASGAKPLAALATEKHFTNLRQLTFGGENAEAYFAADGKRLVFQATRDGLRCDQMFTINVDGTDMRRLSNGEGRTTCGYYYPDGQHLLYASTFQGGRDCPPVPDFSRGYVWPIYHSYDIYRARPDGSEITPLTRTDGYDAEATIGPNGRIVFTSVRDGDMEIYSMNGDGSDVKRLTNRPGPDGGPFFSRDGSMIVWRGKHITDAKELSDYQALLKEGLWRPTDLEIFVMKADGSGIRQVTHLGHANFAPYFTPDGKKVIFSSNHHDPKGRNFDLFLVNIDGTGLERVTFNDTFDGFPMFSPDGKSLVFASNRNNVKPTDTNIFMADWAGR